MSNATNYNFISNNVMLMIQFFFIKNISSTTEIIKTFDYLSLFSGLKINKTKCKIARIGVLKGVKLALCGMKCVDLNNYVIKILQICYSYDKKLENEKKLSQSYYIAS